MNTSRYFLVGAAYVVAMLLSITFSFAATSCVSISKNLSFGSRWSEVVTLQQFLISQNLLATGNNTGYFGNLTQTAVRAYQRTHNLVSSGTSATTGYGAVGPKTRAAMAQCTTRAPIPPQPPVPPTPPVSPSPQSCTWNGQRIQNGASVTAYQTSLVAVGLQCQSQTRTCNNGILAGSYQYDSCSVAGSSCVPLSPQTQMLSCPTGQTGSITQTRSSSCASGASLPTWNGWTTTANTCVAPAQATMNDFWNGTANFELVRRDFNVSQDIVVHDGAWYNFSVAGNSVPQGCTISSRLVVSKSTDQGATWSSLYPVVVPTQGTPWACSAADGHAFFDGDTTTWHYVFQCEKGDGWNICHASRAGSDPIGAWVVDPAPSVTSGSLFQKMGMPSFSGEGTPEIVQKIGDKFYMMFHGFDGVHGNRAIAWTRNFKSWSVDTTKPIFDKTDCASWNVPWDAGGCIGSGWASTLIDSSYYYMLIEAADKNLVCTDDQNWVFGLVRTNNLTNPQREQLPGGSAIIFSSAQKNALGKSSPCGVIYASIWQDNGDTFLAVQRAMNAEGSSLSGAEVAASTGRYWYKLKSGTPVASYSFDAGTLNKKYYPSEIISRGNLEARVDNVQWLNPGLSMNGVNSVVTLSDAQILKRAAPWSLEVKLTVTAEPSGAASFIAGDPASGFLSLYKNGPMCAFAITGEGIKSACGDFTRNVSHTVAAVMKSDSVSLVVDGAVVATTPFSSSVPAINRLQVGSAHPDGTNYNLGTWQGTLSKLSFYD